MTFGKCVFYLVLCIIGNGLDAIGSQSQTDANNITEPAKLFPCWYQSWHCGEWHSLTYKLDSRECTGGETPDGKVLIRSMCGLCQSLRLVNSDDATERIILSIDGRLKHCEHRWRPAIHRWSLDPIEQGDIIFIICGKQMHALVIKKFSFFDEKLSYDIAEITITRFPTQIDLMKLTWCSRIADRDEQSVYYIPVGSRTIPLSIHRIDLTRNGMAKEFISLQYDHYYGMTGGPEKISHATVHIAIIHKLDVGNGPTIDLTKFRFKTYEDGLGNRCGSTDSNQVTAVKEKITFLNLHNSTVRALAASSDGSYIVSTGDDGQVVIHHIDKSITKIIGPFKKERLLCLAINQDGSNILAGGEFNLFRSILKINVENGEYSEIEIPSQGITGGMTGLFYYNNDTCIAYVTPDRLSFFDIRDRKLLSSHDIFGGFTGDIAGTPDGNFYAIISMNENNNKSAEPCKLTIFDERGSETLSYQFESCDEGYYSKIAFVEPTCLIVCSPDEKLWKWKWSSQDRKWKIDKRLTVPKGPFSAITSSPDGKTVWVARKQSLLAIDTLTGGTVYESSFSIGPPKSEYISDPITAIKVIPKKNTIALAFWDGQVALMPIPKTASSGKPQQ